MVNLDNRIRSYYYRSIYNLATCSPMTKVGNFLNVLCTTVKEWAKRFREGRESLEDEERIGRPRSAVTSSNTSEIRWRVEEDPHILLRS